MTAHTVHPVEIHVGGPRGVRAFVVTGDRPFLVDTGIPGSVPAILGKLEELGVDPADLALIVITHAHPDHAGSAAELAGTTGAPVLAHHIDAAALAKGASEPVVGRTPQAQAFADALAAGAAAAPGPAYAPVRVTRIVETETALADFGVDARVLPTPGHTPGGLSVVLDTGEIISGDIIGSFEGEPALAGFGTDESAMRESVRRLLALQPQVVHTCHDGSFELARLKAAFPELL